MALILSVYLINYKISGRRLLGKINLPSEIKEFTFGRNSSTQEFIPSINQYTFLNKTAGIFRKSSLGKGYLYLDHNGAYLRKKYKILFWETIRESLFIRGGVHIESSDLIVIKDHSNKEIILEIISAV